jgi:transcriptional regulator
MPVTRFVGKWKVSQNRPAVDREGVVQGLGAMNDVNAAAMSRLVKEVDR